MGCSCTKLLFFIISLIKTDKWMQFQRVPSFNSKVCEGTDVAYYRGNISDRSMCLIECSKYKNCTGVFHSQNTGMCTGCTDIYDISTNPTGTAEGTTYYGRIGCPEGWFRIENSCYTLTGVMTFDEGVVLTFCQFFLTSLEAGAAEADFTAYTDIAMEGMWVVIGTNEPFIFLDWGNIEPNGHTAENCMALHNFSDFKWIDINCKESLKTLCERDALH